MLIQIKAFDCRNDSVLEDEILLQQINNIDLVRLIYPYAHNLGYDMHSKILKNDCLDSDNSNVVNLFH